MKPEPLSNTACPFGKIPDRGSGFLVTGFLMKDSCQKLRTQQFFLERSSGTAGLPDRRQEYLPPKQHIPLAAQGHFFDSWNFREHPSRTAAAALLSRVKSASLYACPELPPPSHFPALPFSRPAHLPTLLPILFLKRMTGYCKIGVPWPFCHK